MTKRSKRITDFSEYALYEFALYLLTYLLTSDVLVAKKINVA